MQSLAAKWLGLGLGLSALILLGAKTYPNNEFGGGVGSRVRGVLDTGTPQTITCDNTGASPVAIEFDDTDAFDTDGWHDPGGANPDEFTVPAGQSGLYLITLNVQWDDTTTTEAFVSQIRVGGTLVAGAQGLTLTNQEANSVPQQSVSVVLELDAADVVTATALCDQQTANNDVDAATITIVRLGNDA